MSRLRCGRWRTAFQLRASVHPSRCRYQIDCRSYARISRWLATNDPSRKGSGVEVEAKRITFRCCERSESVVELKHEHGSGKRAYRHAWIAAFEPPDSVAAHEQARCHVGCGNPSFAASDRQIAAHALKSNTGWQGHRRTAITCSVLFVGHKTSLRLINQTYGSMPDAWGESKSALTPELLLNFPTRICRNHRSRFVTEERDSCTKLNRGLRFVHE